MYVCMYVYMYICMYVYIYAHPPLVEGVDPLARSALSLYSDVFYVYNELTPFHAYMCV